MFALSSQITIGKYSGVKVHEVKITKSIFEYVDRAVIKVPITARIIREGEITTVSAETAKLFSEGDPVTINLGYNGNLQEEFTGFVSRINFSTPLEIECEGYSYQLRKKNFTGTLKKVQLADLLKVLTKDTDIVIDNSIDQNFLIDQFILTGKSGTDILEELKQTSGSLIKFFFTGKVLWAGLQFLKTKYDVKYRMGWNVIKDSELKLRDASKDKYQVNWVGEKKDGTKVKMSAGKDGVVKTKTSHTFTDEQVLQGFADTEHKQLSYDGYEGKIKTFGAPYCEPGCVAAIEDLRYPERGGRYIIESVESNYSTQGFRRSVGIGYKL